jgi:hypothetical protein
MASSILNSDDGVISGTSGLKNSGGDDGVLVFQSKGTETARINTDKQIEAAAGTVSLPSITTTGDTNTGIFFPAADTIAFAEGGAEAMRIDSSGQLMLGTATSTNTLSVDIQNKSASSNNVLVRIKNTTNNEDCGLTIEGESSATTRSYQIGINTALNVSDLTFSGPTGYRFLVGATTVVTMASTGDFSIAGSTATKASGTTWANPSDRRIKKNVRDYGKGLVELQQVRVREWEYNGKGGTTEGIKGLGVVADEIISVLPNTVDTYEDKLNADDEETTDIKRFDATEITWLLVRTHQDLSPIKPNTGARPDWTTRTSGCHC